MALLVNALAPRLFFSQFLKVRFLFRIKKFYVPDSGATNRRA